MNVSTGRLRDERGFTITEVVVAAMILLVGVLGTLTLLDGANKATQRTKAREGATNLAREVVEASRVVGYPDLTPAQVETELQAQPGLGDALPATAGWNIQRRNVTYTVTASVCSVDDGTLATDGFGDHAGGFFCADSTTQGTQDPNPDDYKRLTIDISWKDGSKTMTSRQEAVINNPGSAFAPAIKTLIPNKGNGVAITSSSDETVVFSATTSSTPTEVKWSLENVEAGKATGAGKAWSFTWQIPNATRPNPVVDGTYFVGATAYDMYGQAGTSRMVTMIINRYAPAAPENLVGGRNPLWGSDVAEFEWAPNPERDIIGYRVYRVDPLALAPADDDEPVCEKLVDDPSPTSCVATGQPGGLQRYYVRAIAPSRTGPGEELSVRPGALDVLVVTGNVRPDAPTNVQEDLTVDDGGTVTLTWDVPTDPDGSIRYYRIYRDDNTSYTVRYGGTGSGAQNAWTDRDGSPGAHRYWVTAVDNHLAESDFAPTAGFAP